MMGYTKKYIQKENMSNTLKLIWRTARFHFYTSKIKESKLTYHSYHFVGDYMVC